MTHQNEEMLPAVLRDDVDETRVAENWHGVVRRQVRRKQRRVAARGAFAVAAVIALWFAVPRETPPLELASGERLTQAVWQSDADERELALSDESIVTLSPNTELRVVRNQGREFRLVLGRGAAHFEVTPGGPRTWSVRADDVEVTVVGTGFRVSRSESGAVDVSVFHGKVRVVAPRRLSGARLLEAGESLQLGTVREGSSARVPSTPNTPPQPSRPAPSRTDNDADPAATSIPVPDVAVRAEATPRAASTPRVRPIPATPRAVAPQGMQAADDARRTGRFDEAADLYARIANDPSSPSRALAAFYRARVELQQRRDPAAAIEWTDRARTLGLTSSLDDAWASLRVESFRASNAPARAEEEARRYLATHPSGALAPRMRALLGDAE
jgi:transmembrane sensor